MKKILLVFMGLLPFALMAQRDWSQAVVSTTEVVPGIYRLMVDDRVSVVAYTGEQGLLVIDAAYEQTTPQLTKALEQLSRHPVDFLINTHIHGDHTGGNAVIGRNARIIAHTSVRDYLATPRRQADRVIPALPDYALPDICFTDAMTLVYNSEELQLRHLPEGHTGGDIIVHFPLSHVLVMGDLLFADNFPFVDVANGGNPLGFMKNLQWVIDNYPKETILIGGHGPVYTMSEFRQYHASLLKTLEVVRSAKAEGMDAQQMKAARILEPWKEMGLFFITEDRWIDTLYPYL